MHAVGRAAWGWWASAALEHSKGHLTWNVGPVGGVSTGAQRAKGKPVGKRTCRLGGVLRSSPGCARRLSKRSTSVKARLGTTAIDFDVGARQMHRGRLGCP